MTTYEKNINSLIPKAEQEATRKLVKLGIFQELRPGKDGERSHCFWSEFFHKAMKRLAIEAGYRTC